MNRRNFFRLLSGVPALGFLSSGATPSQDDPVHECADRPSLPCPACDKATGNPFATWAYRKKKRAAA
jgi:hypothetical protein